MRERSKREEKILGILIHLYKNNFWIQNNNDNILKIIGLALKHVQDPC